MTSFPDIDVHVWLDICRQSQETYLYIGNDYMQLSLWDVPLAEWFFGNKCSKHKSSQCSFAAL